MSISALVLAAATVVAGPPPAPSEAAEPWVKRERPVRGMWELGGFGGVMIIQGVHDFYDPEVVEWRRIGRAAPDIGLRASYNPLSFVGVEGEFASMFTKVRGSGEPVFLYGLRLSAVLQLPLYRFAPFLLGGYGIMGVRSDRDALGNDVDPVGHLGLGLKFFASPYIAVRLDGRLLMAAAAGQRNVVSSHGEILLGVSVTLGRRKAQRSPSHPAPAAPRPPVDSDGDGVADAHDQCPSQSGGDTKGCPPADSDGDTIVDTFDECPNEAGTTADGCPPAPPPATPEPEPEPPPSKLPPSQSEPAPDSEP